MTKQDIITQVAAQTGHDPAIVREIFEASIQAMRDNVSKGETIFIRGFATIGRIFRKEKKVRNINMNTAMLYKGRHVVNFVPAREFKDAIALIPERWRPGQAIPEKDA